MKCKFCGKDVSRETAMYVIETKDGKRSSFWRCYDCIVKR